MSDFTVIVCYSALLLAIGLIMYLASRVKDPRSSIVGLRVPSLVNDHSLWVRRHRIAAIVFVGDAIAFCVSAALVRRLYVEHAVPTRVLLTALFVSYALLPLYLLTRPPKSLA